MAAGQLRSGLGLPCWGLKPCIHPGCPYNTSYRGKGLCRRCSTNPAVRRLYPDLYPFRPDPHAGGRNPRSRRAPGPTSARPGTTEKIMVMRERVRLGYATEHPLDAGADDELDGTLTARNNAGRQRHRVFLGKAAQG